MEQLDTRLQRYGLLWGRWLPGERLYRSGGCSVYILSPADGGEDFPCVVKVLTLLGEGGSPDPAAGRGAAGNRGAGAP